MLVHWYIGVNKISCFRLLYLFSHPFTRLMCVHLVLSLRANSFYDVWWFTYCPYCVQITTALVLYNIRSLPQGWHGGRGCEYALETVRAVKLVLDANSAFTLHCTTMLRFYLNRLRDITDSLLKPSCFSPSLLSITLFYRITQFVSVRLKFPSVWYATNSKLFRCEISAEKM